MTGSRRFLLLLVLASVTCVVLIQMTMDGKNIGRSLEYSGSSVGKALENVPEINNTPANIKKNSTPTIIQTSPKIKPTSPRKPTTINKPKENRSAASKASTVVTPQVRQLPLAKAKQSTQNSNLVSRHDRIQEIMKRSKLARVVDPMRSLKSIPITNPNGVNRILIITYFRAGSSFFGDILQQNWKTFYHFEPLHSMTYDKRIDDNRIAEVFSLFDNIFKCNFSSANNYIQWVRHPSNQFLFAHNLFLWVTCHGNPKNCFNTTFVDAVCERAPIHVMKVTRLHMRHLRSYLEGNPDMNIKVVYLTRDPRGILSSRRSLEWCKGTNCSDSGVLCHEMDEDVKIFNELRHQQPENFIKVRYEDLSLNPEKETENLFKFLHLPFSTSVKKFLKTHTIGRKEDVNNPYSTRRNSSSMVFSWKERFSYKQIVDVQSQCENVLKKLNHSLITSPDQLPYPNGKPKPITTARPREQKIWRYHNNPLAKKYLAKQLIARSSNSAFPTIPLKASNSNNTNIEIHKSFKVLGGDSLKNKNDPKANNNFIT